MSHDLFEAARAYAENATATNASNLQHAAKSWAFESLAAQAGAVPTPLDLEKLVAYLEGCITSIRVQEIEITEELMDLISGARLALARLPAKAETPKPIPPDQQNKGTP